jgi:phosphoribosylamine--glycine ligase
MAAGESFEFKVKRGFHLGTRIVVPPFPYNDRKTFYAFSKNNAILFKKPNFEGIHIEDVKLVKNEWVITGTSGTALVVCASAPTMKQAQNLLRNRISNIIIPNMYYRIDIGDRWYEDSDKLHSWGYLREN